MHLPNISSGRLRRKIDELFQVITAISQTAITFASATVTGALSAGSAAVTGTTTLSGAVVTPVTTVAAATYDLLITDSIVHVDYTTTGAVTSLTLPTAQLLSGRRIWIKDVDGNAAANNITIDTEGAETIDGAATKVISANYGAVELYSDGTNWYTL